MKYRFLPLLSVALATALTAQAQFDSNHSVVSITGSVQDSARHAVQGAHVLLVDSGNGITVTSAYTNAFGQFSLSDFRPGLYEVVAQNGTDEARERVDARLGPADVTLRLARAKDPAPQKVATVSVADYQVPRKARQAYDKASQAMLKGRLEDADRYTEEALQIFPAYSDALTLRAIRRLDQGMTESALADLDQATKSDSSNTRALLVMASGYNSLHKFDDAIRILNRVAQLAPDAWQGFYEMAKAQFGKADYAAALHFVERAQSGAPATFSALTLAKAQILVALRNYSAAGHELEAFLTAKPQDPQATAARAMLDQVKAFQNR